MGNNLLQVTQMKRYYTSRDFGIKYPIVPKIFIGGCGSWDERHYTKGDSSSWAAHAHVCKEDRSKGLICFWYKWDIYNSDGTASKILWHEYAHLLNSKAGFDCPHDLTVFEKDFDRIQKSGHDKSWRKIMFLLRQDVHLGYYDSEEHKVEELDEFSKTNSK